MKCFSPSGGGPVGMTAIGSVLYVCGDADAAPAACEGTVGTIPLSPVGELGATTGDIEFGSAVEEAGVASWASTAGGFVADAAAGRTAGGGTAVGPGGVSGLVESADANFTGSAAGTDGPGAAATVVGGSAAPAGAAAPIGPA